MKKIAIQESLHFGWLTFRGQQPFFIKVVLIYLAITFGPFMFRDIQSSFMQLLVAGAFMVLGTVVNLGMMQICLRYCDGQTGELSELFTPAKLFLRYFLASFIYFVAVVLGLVLLVAPGIWLAVRLSYYDYLIVDKEMGPIESLKASFTLTRGAFWDLLWFLLVVLLLDIAGLLCLVVGSLVTIPVTMLARARVYRHLENSAAV
jgi:uncharacterized membrane protein